LRPSMQLRGPSGGPGVMIQHIEPHLDPGCIEHNYRYQGSDHLDARVREEMFAGQPHEHCLMGHHHRWSSITPTGAIDWSGDHPLELERMPRTITIVDAVLNGSCALLDMQMLTLHPLSA